MHQMAQGCSFAVKVTFSGLSSPSTGTFSMADSTFKPAAGNCRLKGAQLKLNRNVGQQSAATSHGRSEVGQPN